jgi:hypothetical protein
MGPLSYTAYRYSRIPTASPHTPVRLLLHGIEGLRVEVSESGYAGLAGFAVPFDAIWDASCFCHGCAAVASDWLVGAAADVARLGCLTDALIRLHQPLR